MPRGPRRKALALRIFQICEAQVMVHEALPET
jgi:hypothetical protein